MCAVERLYSFKCLTFHANLLHIGYECVFYQYEQNKGCMESHFFNSFWILRHATCTRHVNADLAEMALAGGDNNDTRNKMGKNAFAYCSQNNMCAHDE